MTNPEIIAIEKAVQARSYVEAKTRISKFSKKLKVNDAMHFQICDWYRRLGLFSAGFHYLTRLSNRVSEKSPSYKQFEHQETLWRIQFLNLMGAKEFALQLAESFTPQTYQECQILAYLYQANFDPKSALPLFKRMMELDQNPSSHISLIHRTSYAECLFDNGFRDEAIKDFKIVLKENPNNSTLLGSTYQSLGESYARCGDYKNALKALEKGRNFFPATDESWDRGFLIKWQGYSQAKLGNLDQAKEHFRESEKLLFKKNYRPEPFLHLLILKANVGLASPRELRVLAEYPGLTPGLIEEIKFYLGPNSRYSKPIDADFIYSIPFDEFKDPKNKHAVGIPKELLLFFYVEKTGHLGLPQAMACNLLWPRHANVFLTLLPRLEQLAHRLRTRYKIKIEQEQLRFLNLSKISAWESPAEKPAIFEQKSSFTKNDFSKFYSISKPQTNRWLAKWKKNGWIEAKRKLGAPILFDTRRATPDSTNEHTK